MSAALAPYRTASPVLAACAHTKRCCGVCHAAVGGCLQGVTLTTAGGPFGIGRTTFGAGMTMDRPTGTGARCWCATHERWEDCDEPDHAG